MKVSVIIPTKNAGALFKKVLNVVLTQKVPWDYEVLVIDSGSSDGTVEYVQSKNEVRLHQIPAKEFGHGKTRNLGISLTHGEFVAMLTHDALPANETWLVELVNAVEQSGDVAGSFGRHIAYEHDGPFLKRDLQAHFDGFLSKGALMRLADPERYRIDERYRQLLHFFSDNNACIRRSVWKKIPYPDVDFAEDQLWAKQIIEAGYAKGYADRAVVYHSHSFGFGAQCRRSFDEAWALHQHFGYCLCPSLLHMIRQSVRTTIADYQHGLQQGVFVDDPVWLGRIPMRNTFRQIGFYLGQRADMFPLFFVNRFSRDKSLMMS